MAKEGTKVFVCPSCGMKQTLPLSFDPILLDLMEQATLYRNQGEYDEASALLESLLSDHPQEPEIYWNLLLARYGVIYEGEKIRLGRTYLSSLLEDPLYLELLHLASKETKEEYRHEAKEIASLQQREIVKQEQEKRNEDFYQQALSLKEEKDYSEAEELFLKIGNYKDSKKQAKECVELRNKRIYRKAMNCILDMEYESAIALFRSIPDYQDAKEKAEECEESRKKEIYRKAKRLLEEREYDYAIALFQTISTYRDVKERIAQCEQGKKQDLYDKAFAWKEQKRWEEARLIFEGLDGFLDSAYQAKDCRFRKREERKERVYQAALLREKEYRFDSALFLFQAIPTYKDVTAHIQHCEENKRKEEIYQNALALSRSSKKDPVLLRNFVFSLPVRYRDSEILRSQFDALLRQRRNKMIAVLIVGISLLLLLAVILLLLYFRGR